MIASRPILRASVGRAVLYRAGCAAVILVAAGACAQRRQQRVVDACTSNLTAVGGMSLLIGRGGIQQLCRCTTAEVYARVPDADQRATDWLSAVNARASDRGLLGALADTAWFRQRAVEADAFGAAFGTALARCTQELVQAAGRPQGNPR